LIKESFYKIEEVIDKTEDAWMYWFTQYLNRLQQESLTDTDRKAAMNQVNPKYVLRNYMSQLAIEAEKRDYSNRRTTFTIENPYQDQDEYHKWFAKRPDWAREK
jgi:uncharacterized protein YdiU (UPF0061 family)